VPKQFLFIFSTFSAEKLHASDSVVVSIRDWCIISRLLFTKSGAIYMTTSEVPSLRVAELVRVRETLKSYDFSYTWHSSLTHTSRTNALRIHGRKILGFVFTLSLFFSACAFTAQDAVRELLAQAAAAAEKGDSAEVIRLTTAAIEKDPKAATAYYLRGRERLRSASFRESVSDFDQYVRLRPDEGPRQWERGIACYYAGMHEAGAKQFELYQTFDGHDVENSVWRFLCMVPTVGVKKAQAVMLPIENDRRVPMMHVFDLYRGRLKPEDVLNAARAGMPSESELAARLFYAHLYLALWHDANGEMDLAKKYAELAAAEKLKDAPGINRFMWDIARIHRQLLAGELKRPK
jgi:lipoprotein NlpI